MDVMELLLSAAPMKLPEKDYKIKRLSKELGKDVVFRLRAVHYSRIAEIRRVGIEEQDIHIVLAGVVAPDLKNDALMARFNAVTPAELIKNMLLPGEIDDLALRVEKLSGYKSVVTEEVKKN